MKGFTDFTKKSYRRIVASMLMVGMALSVLPNNLVAQDVRPNQEEERALLVLREASRLASSDAMKDELRAARKALEDARSNRGADAVMQELQRAQTILRQIIDNPRGEGDGFVEKVAEALRIVEQAGAPSCCGVDRASVETGFGLHVATFDTLQGTVSVNLPDDLQAGDTISGSVIAEPKGKTEAERAENQSELNGYVVQIDKEQVSAEKQYAKLLVPTAMTALPVLLKNREGKEVARTEVPAIPTPQEVKPNPVAGKAVEPQEITGKDGGPGAYQTPAIGQAGKPVEIKGAFDGDLRTSAVNIANKAVRVLAESPRKVIAQSPAEAIGSTNIEVAERGKVVARCRYQSVGVRLSAQKLNLIRGEQTTMTVTLVGGNGIEGPVRVQLTNKTPWVVRMSGGERQLLVIKPGEMGSGGFGATRTLTGIQPGGFAINAVVSSASNQPGRCDQPGDAGLDVAAPSPDIRSQKSGARPTDNAATGELRQPYRSEPPVSQKTGGDNGLDANGEPTRSTGSRPAEPLRGRFRVTLNGFFVNNQTADGLGADGAGDEVTLVSSVATVDRNSRLSPIIWGNVFTSIMGQQPRYSIRAGRATPEGGLITGDGFPTTTPWLRSGSLNPGIPPTVLFEGDLEQRANAALIIPTIWEWDGPDALQRTYADAIDAARLSIISLVRKIILYPPPLEPNNYLFSGFHMGLSNRVTLGRDLLGYGETNNRPIGMRGFGDRFSFTPLVLVLTYDAAMHFARINSRFGRGVLEVRYRDDGDLEGFYSLFLQIEVLPRP